MEMARSEVNGIAYNWVRFGDQVRAGSFCDHNGVNCTPAGEIRNTVNMLAAGSAGNKAIYVREAYQVRYGNTPGPWSVVLCDLGDMIRSVRAVSNSEMNSSWAELRGHIGWVAWGNLWEIGGGSHKGIRRANVYIGFNEFQLKGEFSAGLYHIPIGGYLNPQVSGVVFRNNDVDGNGGEASMLIQLQCMRS
jgi:hypothetical protein